jgi:ABC-type uncharacterized transport system ATPase subunit
MLITLDFDEMLPLTDLQRRQRDVILKLLQLAETGKYQDKLQVFTQIFDIHSLLQQPNVTLSDGDDEENTKKVENKNEEIDVN